MASTLPQQSDTRKHTPLARPAYPAGFFSRSLAFVIDLIILSAVQLAGSAMIQLILRFFRLTQLVTYFKSILENATINIAIGGVLFTLIVIGYYTFFWTLVGFTPGKAIMGLKVVRKNGSKLSFGRSLLRFFCYWISALPLFLGYFWVLWDRHHRAWHDKIAGTQVLYTPKSSRK